MKCWGFDLDGQLGLGGGPQSRGDKPGQMRDALPRVDLGSQEKAFQVAAGGSHSCALLDRGRVKCWGKNDHGQLGLGDTKGRGVAASEMGDALAAVDLGGRRAVQIVAGSAYTCVMLEDGAVVCWGDNHNGELGVGDTNDRGDAA